MELGHLQDTVTETEIKAGRQTDKDLKCNCMLSLLACWEKPRTNLLLKQPSNYLSLQGDNQCMKRASEKSC